MYVNESDKENVPPSPVFLRWLYGWHGGCHGGDWGPDFTLRTLLKLKLRCIESGADFVTEKSDWAWMQLARGNQTLMDASDKAQRQFEADEAAEIEMYAKRAAKEQAQLLRKAINYFRI